MNEEELVADFKELRRRGKGADRRDDRSRCDGLKAKPRRTMITNYADILASN